VSGIGDRHSGTAGGSLRPGGKPVSVEIRLGTDAFRTSVQHTAWMLVNILCRLQGAVSIVQINCPSGIKVPMRLSPLITEGEELRDALISGARAIGSPEDGFVSVELLSQRPKDIVVGVGFELCADATFCAVGNGLCGGIFSREIAPPARFSELTVGPYIAACLAAGEIFRLVRLNSYLPERQLFLNAMDYSHGTDPTWSDLEIGNELRSVLLVGVGAVGSAMLHALFPLPVRGTILLADNDDKGIDITNLGRYSLFGWASLGKPKATEAAQLMQQAEFQTVSYEGSFEYFFTGTDRPRIVLSAVDKNTARHALQEQYAPLYISASTHNLRMEVLRCGPPAEGACLACFNPLETEQRTEDEIRALLRDKPEIEANLREKLKLDANEVAAWIRGRKCSETGDRLVSELRTDDGSAPAFAVGFVSVLAGTLLAAELLKTIGRHPGALDEDRNRAVFQFQNPAAATNTLHFYSRDGQCMACSPENLGTQIWRRRYATVTETQNRVIG
jgi:molybdopterin/thiamine biosynthesis adenylyltransferase